jgi:hypothetical protein
MTATLTKTPLPPLSLSWAELAEREYGLQRLERLAVWMAEHAGADWCANEIFYSFLKPQLVQLVGWCRGHLPTCAIDGPRPMFIDWSTFWERPGSVPATTDAEKMLRSCAAYDVAYDYLYGLLPDCRHGDGTWCG